MINEVMTHVFGVCPTSTPLASGLGLSQRTAKLSSRLTSKVDSIPRHICSWLKNRAEIFLPLHHRPCPPHHADHQPRSACLPARPPLYGIPAASFTTRPPRVVPPARRGWCPPPILMYSGAIPDASNASTRRLGCPRSAPRDSTGARIRRVLDFKFSPRRPARQPAVHGAKVEGHPTCLQPRSCHPARPCTPPHCALSLLSPSLPENAADGRRGRCPRIHLKRHNRRAVRWPLRVVVSGPAPAHVIIRCATRRTRLPAVLLARRSCRSTRRAGRTTGSTRPRS